jgi:hypothetical protein
MKGAIGLESQADPTAHALKCRQARHVFVLEEHAANVGLVDAAQKRKERGFSRSIGTDNAAQLPAWNADAHVVCCHHTVEVLR